MGAKGSGRWRPTHGESLVQSAKIHGATELGSKSVGILGALLTGTAIMWLIIGPAFITVMSKIFESVNLWFFIILIFVFLMIWRQR